MKVIANGRQDVQHLLPEKSLHEYSDQVNCSE